MLIEGPPGAGRTALWRVAVRLAAERGWRTVSTRPGETESRLAHMALMDLVGPRFDEAAHTLPAPQREALEVALLRMPATGEPDPRAVALGALTLLRSLATPAGLMIAIDDVQWLDEDTGRVLHVVLKRLAGERVCVLATVRVTAWRTPALEIVLDAVDPGDVTRTRLGPMDIDDLDRILGPRLGRSLLRLELRELAERSGGLPKVALQLVRPISGDVGSGRLDDPAPASGIDATAADRLATLDAESRRLLVSCALLSRPSRRLLGEVASTEGGAMAAAVRAELIESDDGWLRFRDPDLANAVMSSVPDAALRALRRWLADAVSDPHESALQLAMAAEVPDGPVAQRAEVAAVEASINGEPDRAAQLMAHAVRLTPADDQQRWLTRCLDLGLFRLRAGDTAHARLVLEQAVTRARSSADRARGLHRLALARARMEGWIASIETLEAALLEAGPDVVLRRIILMDLSRHLAQTVHQPAALGCAVEAVRLAESSHDTDAIGRARAVAAYIRFLTGSGPPDGPDDAAPQAGSARDVPMSWMDDPPDAEPAAWDGSVYLDVALLRKWSDAWDEARAMMERVATRATLRHEEAIRAGVVFQRGEIEVWAGDLPEAAACANQANALGLQHGAPVLTSLYLHALLAVHGGRAQDARSLAAEGIARSMTVGNHRQLVRFTALNGQLELGLGDPRAACSWLLQATELAERACYGEPAVLRYDADTIEALVLAGRLDEARQLHRRLDDRATRLGRPWTVAAAARCLGILRATEGDDAAAAAAFESAIRLQRSMEQPYEAGRSLLAYGRTLRRSRQRRRAREVLGDAITILESRGFVLWATAARAEVARISGPVPAVGVLTPTEWRVATLAASGLTNREIAGRAGMSVKTVESHLSRAYAKLSVRSRTQLGGMLVAFGHTESDPPGERAAGSYGSPRRS